MAFFKFNPNQEHQITAINSVVDLLRGQNRLEVDLLFVLDTGLAAIPNRLDLDETILLNNLKDVQDRNGLKCDEGLQMIEENIITANGSKLTRFPNFSIEMETGTGKTYVYLRTVLELFRRYGMRKFIVVVPSVAIREGVLKTLKVTESHFSELFENTPYRYYVYDSSNISQIRQFALSANVEIMVMTIDSFNKASNVIRQATDRLQGETPLYMVQATRPVLILDEPQNMESELRVKALSALDPLFALRYSATHRNPYNLIYRLTPFDAYRQGLVKRIEVASVVKEDDENQIFMRLDSILSRKNTVTARIAVHKLMKTGVVKEQIVTVVPGESLEEKTSRPEYAPFVVDEINPGQETITFANGLELKRGESQGADKEAIFEAQIRYTIEEHLRKQHRYKDDGIKVLSLFFIDRVDNYAPADGLIRRLFSKAFDGLKSNYSEWKDLNVEAVQAAYFAEKRHRGGVTESIDSVTGKTKEDEAAFNLIMRDKERLLSFTEPVCFIFSHSALREGWDNPNVFQICTLNQTASEIKKRQEVGRGVRLAVNQTGDRVHDERTNVLTVVANESYEKYVETLQQEIEDEYGKEGLPPKPANARKRGVAKLRKEFTLKPEFKELWERIKHKTRYTVKIDTGKVISEVVSELEKIEVKPPRIAITKAHIQAGNEEDVFRALQMSAAKSVRDLSGRFPLPNLLDIMSNLMEHSSPPVRITRRTLLEIFKRMSDKTAATNNPHGFATAAVQLIKDRLADHLVNGIKYYKINEWYEMTQLEIETQSWLDYMVPSKRSVYDHITYESEVERKFVEGLEQREDVKLYLKLPNWFKVLTPVGEYNPDWAIVMEERDEHGQATTKPLLYLVRETKDTHKLDDLRPDERRKVQCGEQHFKGALGVDYKVVTRADELP
jgi:type III restriction enzyme